MSRYIDADALVKWICGNKCGCERNECGYDIPCQQVQLLEGAPSIDIVRCKECKYCVPYSTCGGDWQKCMRNIESLHDVYLNDFCSYGERREP